MPREYVAVKFRATATRTYTYHNDGEPVKCGDLVRVAARDGDGWQSVIVESVSFANPPFPTKPILGLVPPADPAPEVEV